MGGAIKLVIAAAIVAAVYEFGSRARMEYDLGYKPYRREFRTPGSLVQERGESVRLPCQVTGQGNGCVLHGMYVRGGAEWGPQVPLLLLHGSQSDHSAFYPLAEKLAESGYPLFLLDFPGHGLSSGRVTWNGQEVRAAGVALDWLKKRVSTDQGVEIQGAGVLGYSMGGWIAVRLLEERNDLTSVALMATPYDAEESFASVGGKLGYLGSLPSRGVSWWMGTRYWEDTPALVLSRLTSGRILFLQGDEDTVVSEKSTRKLFQITQVEKEIEVIKGADHQDLLSDPRDDLVRALRSFFGVAQDARAERDAESF